VNALRRTVGRGFLAAHGYGVRAYAKGFSLLAAGAFAEFGRASVLQPPVRLAGVHRIHVGSGVFVGAGSWLQVLEGERADPRLRVGDGTSIAGGCVISAACSVSMGRNVLVARNVYIADHQHAFEDVTRPVLSQGVTRLAPVEIGDGAWLGENVVVGPGVRIGCGSVVGANAVVLESIPDHSVAVGAPARVVRTFAATTPVAG
jgi:lipopolysaccharide O-acetyltransferase